MPARKPTKSSRMRSLRPSGFCLGFRRVCKRWKSKKKSCTAQNSISSRRILKRRFPLRKDGFGLVLRRVGFKSVERLFERHRRGAAARAHRAAVRRGERRFGGSRVPCARVREFCCGRAKIAPGASSVEEIPFGRSGEESALGNDVHEGVILESEDGTVRVRLTIDQIVRELKDKRSFELASTLFGGALPQ